MSADSGPGRREVAQRLFAVEFDAADYEYAESDEERAPKYVVTPTGARVNRLFAVGVLTEVEPVNDDVLRARVVDQTGAFVVYAGQYQPDAKTFLERAAVPSFVAVTGKANTFQPDGSDRVFTSVRPESLSEVDAETRDRWTVDAAEHTLGRIAVMGTAIESGKRGADLRRSLDAAEVDADLAAGIPLAIDHYGTTPDYLAELREIAIAAAEVVAGERDEVGSVELTPDAVGSDDVDLADLGAPSLVDIGELPDIPAPGGESVEDDESAMETPDPDADTEAPVETAHDGADEDDEAEPVEVDAEPPETESSESGVDPESEPEPESGPEAADSAASAGADDPAGTRGGDNGTSDEPLEDFDADQEFELDETEREQLEATYGTEFTSGAEVDAPGEADIETPEPEAVADVGTESDESADVGAESHESADVADTEPKAPADSEHDPDSEPETDSASATESEVESPSEPEESAAGPVDDNEAPEPDAREAETADEAGDNAGEVDLEAAVLDSMRDLADDDGADRDEITAAVVDAHGVDPAAVEDAIQEALMDGECYEPTEGKLKPI